MTRISFQDDRVVLKNTKVGTEQDCKCQPCQMPELIKVSLYSVITCTEVLVETWVIPGLYNACTREAEWSLVVEYGCDGNGNFDWSEGVGNWPHSTLFGRAAISVRLQTCSGQAIPDVHDGLTDCDHKYMMRMSYFSGIPFVEYYECNADSQKPYPECDLPPPVFDCNWCDSDKFCNGPWNETFHLCDYFSGGSAGNNRYELKAVVNIAPVETQPDYTNTTIAC